VLLSESALKNKLKYDEQLANLAFNFNVRRYTKAVRYAGISAGLGRATPPL